MNIEYDLNSKDIINVIRESKLNRCEKWLNLLQNFQNYLENAI